MFLHRICKRLCRASSKVYYSTNRGGEFLIPEEEEIIRKKLKEIGNNNPRCFCPLRFYINNIDTEKYDIILNLRDPRDVLVSMYYSFCYSHPGEIEGYTGYRKTVADNGIDNFVLMLIDKNIPDYLKFYGTGDPNTMGNVKERYERYIYNLIGKPNVIFVKYEDMVSDFNKWLSNIIVPFGITSNSILFKYLVYINKNSFAKQRENVWNHKRKVVSGGYKDKLKSNTVKELNKRLERILVTLNYEI